jgi:hypothetical protein
MSHWDPQVQKFFIDSLVESHAQHHGTITKLLNGFENASLTTQHQESFKTALQQYKHQQIYTVDQLPALESIEKANLYKNYFGFIASAKKDIIQAKENPTLYSLVFAILLARGYVQGLSCSKMLESIMVGLAFDIVLFCASVPINRNETDEEFPSDKNRYSALHAIEKYLKTEAEIAKKSVL